MAKPRKLKVYRTTAGFHDAYVAAPSKKAALEAWGTTKDLFARGVAEQIEDQALMSEPLASPGVVFKQLRGTAAEQVAALGKTEHPRKAKSQKLEPAAKPKRAPKPSDAELKEAQATLEAARARQHAERHALIDRIAQLQAELKTIDRQSGKEIARLEQALSSQRNAYEKRLQLWRMGP